MCTLWRSPARALWHASHMTGHSLCSIRVIPLQLLPRTLLTTRLASNARCLWLDRRTSLLTCRGLLHHVCQWIELVTIGLHCRLHACSTVHQVVVLQQGLHMRSVGLLTLQQRGGGLKACLLCLWGDLRLLGMLKLLQHCLWHLLQLQWLHLL